MGSGSGVPLMATLNGPGPIIAAADSPPGQVSVAIKGPPVAINGPRPSGTSYSDYWWSRTKYRCYRWSCGPAVVAVTGPPSPCPPPAPCVWPAHYRFQTIIIHVYTYKAAVYYFSVPCNLLCQTSTGPV